MRHAMLLLPLCAASRAAAAGRPVVTLPGGGGVRGSAGGGVDRFLGVPYAEPPVGHRRWRAPAARAPWAGARDAAAFGASCPFAGGGCGATSEDCLFLNVYAPSARTAGAALPVMVWIHGGGYIEGCGAAYDGAALVAGSGGEVVVVTLNYRLNVFGFLGAEQLRGRDDGNSTGNYGIQDQRLAMQWVRDNIAAFGGDAGSVTIFGESAGAGSVATHLVAPRSFGLYDRAIAESGAAAKWDCNVMAKAQRTYDALAKALGCGSADCLVALPAKVIAAAQIVAGAVGFTGTGFWKSGNALPFAPTVDGVELTAQVWELMRDGKANPRAPVLLGSNRDEFAAFLGGVAPNMTELGYRAYAETLVTLDGLSAAPKLREMYAPGGGYAYPADLGGYSQWWWAAQRTTTDSCFVCPARRAARWLARGGNPVYLYMFAHPVDGGATAPHGCEISYVFPWPGMGAGEAALSAAMVRYWASFARAGDPNGGGAPRWPRYTAAGDASQRLDVAPAGVTTEKGLRRAACDLHDSLYPRQD